MNVTKLMADYTDFIIRGRADGGYSAQARGKDGRPIGKPMDASSLDELAELMDACRRRVDGM
jgi:hypothetical protein